ncbi:MAG: alkaline phosphatase D family protein [Steroidobacteraceae bacterium]
MRLDRRSFIACTAAALLQPVRAASPPRANPFTLGVASGYPTSASVVLWTRLAPEPLSPDGGMGLAPVEVRWEVAEDETFRRIAASGSVWAQCGEAHSVHVEPFGLQPAREYWYRFTLGDHRSPVGHTRTATAPGVTLTSLRAAVVSCQHYEHAEYAAYRHLAASAPELVLHLGDYIYESSVQRPWGRSHVPTGECFTLADYRLRYSQYKLDPSLQAAHAVAPWMVMWDDHEVENDYAGTTGEDLDPREAFLLRRAAAYQAFYEHLPVPRRAVPFGPNARLTAQRTFGDLASIVLLDGRQFRSPQACNPGGRGGATRTSGCAELTAPDRTMWGATQEAWLGLQLAESRARWNLIAQGTPMTWMDQEPGDGTQYWTDGWTGYPAARDRFITQVRDTRVANPLVLSGDVHSFGWGQLRPKAGKSEGPVVVPELITTSISSNPVDQKVMDGWLADSPELGQIDGTRRGYLELRIGATRIEARQMAVDDARNPASSARVAKVLGIEVGSPKIGT